MRIRHTTFILVSANALAFALAAPASLREAYEKGGIYLFSHDFVADIPKRLTGPGRLRFLFQPLTAIVLGIKNGLADARAGRPPFLLNLLFHSDHRAELLRSVFKTLANLLLVGILMDSVLQWMILGVSYPGAALVVGPVLIVTPYMVARALSNRIAALRKRG